MIRKKLLLHTCCAPCSVHVGPELSATYDVICYFYNPNIDDEWEYRKRLDEMKFMTGEMNLSLVEGSYDRDRWLACVRGLEDEPEGGSRCLKCFQLRLLESCRAAEELGCDEVMTTLTVAPVKNHALINRVGEESASGFSVVYVPSNFKKYNGYVESVRKSKEMGLYRQDFCGCSFSLRSRAPGIKKEEKS